MQIAHTVIAALLLIAVLVLIIVRPRNLNVAWPASTGALLAIVAGLVPLPTLNTIFHDTWDACATLIALFLLSEALDSNGFFSWSALHLARFAGGSGRKLYILVLLLTIGTTTLLANDGAVLILTPIFARLLVKIYPKEALWLPFVFAAGFLADAASGIFVPSNLTNIIVADANGLNFTTFAQWMVFPTLCAALAAGLCFGLRFRASLGSGYDMSVLEEPASALRDRPVFWTSWGALLVLVIGYIVGGQLRLPISLIAGPVALCMVVLVQVRRIRPATAILRAAPWHILFYALGMFVIITAVYDAHVLAFLTIPLRTFVVRGVGASGWIKAGGILALLSACTNNLPATLIGVLVLKSTSHPSVHAIYASILGVDIGPKLTPFGSLATLLWLGILARNGIHISWRKYLSENWWVTLLALAASFAGLLLMSLLLLS